MAQKQAGPALVMVALLLFAAATPMAYGLLGGIVNINGTVCCSFTGNCNGTTPALPGVGVNVTCTNLLGVSVLMGQGVTNVNGTFNISINLNNILPVIGNNLNAGKLPCVATIHLPLNSALCPVLNTTNALLVGVPVAANSIFPQESAVYSRPGVYVIFVFFVKYWRRLDV